MESISYTERIPVRAGVYDVIVAGGGVAGVAAALTAVRDGKKALLIEKSTILGGLGTLGLINLFVPMCNGRGRQIIFGLAEEMLRLSIRHGWAMVPSDWRNGQPDHPTEQRYVARFSPAIFALVLREWLEDSGVELLFDCIVSGTVMQGNHCEGVVIDGKSGREFIRGKMFIDATGDGDLMRRAGVPTVTGDNFDFYGAKAISLESCQKAVKTGRIEDAITGISGGTVNLYGKGQPADVPLWHGTSTDSTNQYLSHNQRLMLENVKKLPNEGFEIVTLPGMLQTRTSCRIDGEYTLKADDAYRHFDDSVGAICDFERRDFLYEMPYRLLIHRGFDNIATAGRCASGEGYAWDLLRVIPPAIITGQAIGNAACLALDSGKGIDQVDVPSLQRMQADQNVMVHFDDALIPKDLEHAGEWTNDFGHV